MTAVGSHLTSDPKNRVNLLRNLREQQETGIFVLFLDLEVYCLLNLVYCSAIDHILICMYRSTIHTDIAQ